MKQRSTIRPLLTGALALAMAVAAPSLLAQARFHGGGGRLLGGRFQHAPAPPPQRNPSSPQQRTQPPQSQQRNNPQPNARQEARQEARQQNREQNQDHLNQWMQNHRDLTPEQQQRALENEQGFRQLPPQTQQRLREDLNRLNNMPDARRERILNRNEQLEHLPPQQRQQVLDAYARLGALPRAQAIGQAFRQLRMMPPDRREAYMNSPAFRSQFSEEERGTLNNLFAVEPYLPASPQQPPPPAR